MNVSDLPRPGIIRNRMELDCLPRLGVDVARKDVLAIGYSRDQLAQAIETHGPRSITVLTKWADHIDARMPGYDVTIGDIGGDPPFAEAQFDVVTTLSVLEHIADIPRAFRNIARILRPGGVFVSTFGPVWSSAYGHHLYADPSDPVVNFSFWQMPGWLHLLGSYTEIKQWFMSQGKTDYEAGEYIRYMFDLDQINRMMFEDYQSNFNQHFLPVTSYNLYTDCPPHIYQALRQRFPRYTDFSSYGGAWVGIPHGKVV